MNQEDAFRCPLRNEDQASLLLDYCARKLDPERQRILELHMKICPQCASFRDSQAAVWAALDDWETSPVARTFDEDLAGRIAFAEREPMWMKTGRWFLDARWAPAVPAVAAAALWVFLLRPTPPPTATAPDAIEPEQAERVLEDLEMLRQVPL